MKENVLKFSEELSRTLCKPCVKELLFSVILFVAKHDVHFKCDIHPLLFYKVMCSNPNDNSAELTVSTLNHKVWQYVYSTLLPSTMTIISQAKAAESSLLSVD